MLLSCARARQRIKEKSFPFAHETITNHFHQRSGNTSSKDGIRNNQPNPTWSAYSKFNARYRKSSDMRLRFMFVLRYREQWHVWADAINLNRIGCLGVCVYIRRLTCTNTTGARRCWCRERELLNVYACVCLCVALKRSVRVGRLLARSLVDKLRTIRKKTDARKEKGGFFIHI